MNELALFAGAGGGILGGHLLGWRTVCAVEYNAYARSVLLARQNDGTLSPFPIWDDVRTFDGKPWRGVVDVVSGGFPCQDISCAGKGVGITGSRSGLWSEMARIVCEVRPRYVYVENSPMLTSRGLGRVLEDLAEMGFDAKWGVLGASDCGAPHKRKRIWILGYANNDGQFAAEVTGSITAGSYHSETWSEEASKLKGSGQQYADVADTLCEGKWIQQIKRGKRENSANTVNDGKAQPLAYSNSERLKEFNSSTLPAQSRQHSRCAFESWRTAGWPPEPSVGRTSDGMAVGLDIPETIVT